MVGVEKNTIESRIAFGARAAATASTASEPPIIVKRRCLRVMPGLWSSHPLRIGIMLSVEPEILQTLIQFRSRSASLATA